jgi:outer membrane immunogenic protein
MSKSKLIIAMVAIASMSSMAMADGYEPSGKGFAPPPVYSWTGFYVGAQAGLATGNTQGGVPGVPFGLTDTDFDMNGGIYGGYAGYNYQTGAWVFGIEGTYSGANVQGDTTLLAVLSVDRELDWLATIEGRVGYAFGKSMVYARGGWAWAKMETNVSLLGIAALSVSGDSTHNGWTAGFGFEHVIGHSVIARLEYAHVDLDTENHALTAGGLPFTIPDNVEGEMDTIRLGVSIKFGGQ